jgi:hypothetical protein
MAYEITRKDWEEKPAICLSKGRAGNACVYRIETPDGPRVVKDFRKSPWWIRWTWGRWMIGHELALMKRLDGMHGIPQKLQRIDAYSFSMELLAGETMSAYNERREKDDSVPALPEAYFEELEAMIHEMHRRKVTHLDNRNAKNVLILDDGRPGLLDFQAGVTLRWWLFPFIKNILKMADISGAYKHWFRVRGELSEERKDLLRCHFKLRRIWVLKGYSLFKRRKPKGIEIYLFGEDGKGGR